jgi:hypothetical protein
LSKCKRYPDEFLDGENLQCVETMQTLSEALYQPVDNQRNDPVKKLKKILYRLMLVMD